MFESSSTDSSDSSGGIYSGNGDDNDVDVGFTLDGMLYTNGSSAIEGSVAVNKASINNTVDTQLNQASLLISQSSDSDLANRAIAVPEGEAESYANIGQQAQVYSITLQNGTDLPTSLSGVEGAANISATVKIALDEATAQKVADTTTYTLKVYNVGGEARQAIEGAKVEDSYLTFTTNLNNIGSLALVLEHTHAYTSEVTTQPGCETAGVTTYTCSVCSEYYTTSIDALGHEYTWRYDWVPDGNGGYKCTANGSCSRDNDTKQVEASEVKLSSDTATCDADGKATYIATFEDALLSTTVTREFDSQMKGHTYDEWLEPVWVEEDGAWVCKATRICSRCGGVDTAKATVTSETVDSTCLAKGKTTYHAVFAAETGIASPVDKVIELDQLTHIYGTPVYVWSEDYSTCTASVECSVGGETLSSGQVQTNCTDLSDDSQDKYEYTVIFDNNLFETQKKTIKILKKVTSVSDAEKGIIEGSLQVSEDTTSDSLTEEEQIQNKANSDFITELNKVLGEASNSEDNTTTTTVLVIEETTNTSEPKPGEGGDNPDVKDDDDTTVLGSYSVYLQSTTKDVDGQQVGKTVETSLNSLVSSEATTKPTVTVSIKLNDAAKQALASMSKTDSNEESQNSGESEGIQSKSIGLLGIFEALKDEDSELEGDSQPPKHTNFKPVVLGSDDTELTFSISDDGDTLNVTGTTDQVGDIKLLQVAVYNYGVPKYVWSDDYSTCTATRVCTDDGCNKAETETVSAVFETTQAATCTSNGLKKATATFENSAFETQVQKDIVVSKTGHHDYTAWDYAWSQDANGNWVCTATRNCAEGDDPQTVYATVKSEVTKKATCTAKGQTTYTAEFVNDERGLKTQTNTVDDIDVIAHSYGAWSFAWSSDNKTCTATKKCSVCGDQQTVTATKVTSATKAATCTTNGSTVYTATFASNTGIPSQTKTVEIAKTGHSYGAWSFSWSSDNKTCTATRKCSKGDGTQTYKSTSVTTKTVAATTTAAGSITYTATFASNTGIAKQTKTTTIAKLQYTSVWRLYNPNNGEHLYTTDANEYKVLASIGWKQEGEAWRSPKSGDAVYRLYNPNSGDHHYTKDLNEYNTLAKLGWKQEGVKFYSSNDSANQVTIYRLFNPNLTAGTHHYTKDANEYKELGRIGWKQENIGFYGIN
jgi:hypothetical protein